MRNIFSKNKVLIVAPAWVGDLVMAQALFKLIKQRAPDTIIDVLALPWAQSLLARMPEVQQMFPMPLGHGELQLKKRWQIGGQLRIENYQQAIVLANSWKSAIVPFAAKIPKRTGWFGEWRLGLLNDIRHLNEKQLPLMVQRFLALGVTPDEISIAQDYLNYRPALKISSEAITKTLEKFKLSVSTPLLALCPGAEYGAAKRWPVEYYAQVAQKKLAEGWQVWLLGGVKDQPIAQAIQKETQGACIDLTGRTTLGEAVDLLSLAQWVVSNDSGLMHIAAALQRPLIVIYGSSSPRFTPPLSGKVKILSLELPCSPCFKRECPLGHLKCLRDLSPDLVLKEMV